MKKILTVVLVLTLVLAGCLGDAGITAAKASDGEWTAGETVTFGVYEQDAVSSNGKEPLEWIVLDTNGNDALLITRYVIDWDYFNGDNGGGSKSTFNWPKSKIYGWLNGTFKDAAFTSEEKSRLVGHTPDGAEVGDVFLLSYEEANTLFRNETERIGYPTKAAISKGAYQWLSGGCWSWLRTPARVVNYDQSVWDEMDWRSAACGIDGNGGVDNWGYIVNRTRRGVRPAIWVSMP